MKRRNFLGMFAGAAIAGPSMVKSAAAETLAGLNVTALSGGIASQFGEAAPYGGAVVSGGMNHWASAEIAKLGLRTASQHEFYKRRMAVHTLDPDLASFRSFALHQKIRMQRDRDYERSLEAQKSQYLAIIAGWFD